MFSRPPHPIAPVQFDGVTCKYNCLNYTQFPPSQRNCAAGTDWWVRVRGTQSCGVVQNHGGRWSTWT